MRNHGRRGRRRSYLGALVIGALHAVLSASIYFSPGGPPIAIALWLTVLPAAVAVAAGASLISFRK